MADDYFTKLNKRTQPVRDMFSPTAPSVSKPPSAAKAPTAPKMEKSGELQGESLDDYNYMQNAVKGIGKRLAPKSVMGKSSSKR